MAGWVDRGGDADPYPATVARAQRDACVPSDPMTFVTLEYARRGINLLHTPLPIFGPNSDVPMEFPLVQAMAAVLIRLGVGPDSAMRIVGLAGFQAAEILLSVLVLRWHGQLANNRRIRAV
jgi:hypothetical protein